MANAKRILITGSTGMVGGRLVERLGAEGHLLTLAVRTPSQAIAAHPQIKTVITGDLETSDRLDEAMQDVDRVIHTAGYAHALKTAPETGRSPAMRANADATARLCEAAARAGVTTFIHVSSIAAVADNAAPDVLTDETTPHPRSDYGRSKLQADAHVAALARTGCLAVSLRPPLILGAKARGNFAALGKAAAALWPLPFASLDARRSVIGLDTLADAIQKCLAAPIGPDRSGAYLVADREALSVCEIVTELRAGMGRPPGLFPVPPSLLALAGFGLRRSTQVNAVTKPLVLDASRFEAAFDFVPRSSSRETLRSIGRELASGIGSQDRSGET